MASVELEAVEKRYPGGALALADVTLAVADAELLVCVGPSGCGKSTLLRLLAGLEAPSAGTLRIGGAVVNELSPQERNVAMVFQDYALYPHLSVRGNLEFPLRMRRLSRAERERRVAWAAGVLAMEGWLDRLPAQLSGGQRQRAAMGRALVREPAVFLLDEPLSNLDARLRAQVREEIAELQRRTQTTMIYVTHDQTEAMTLGSRVAILNRGRLQQVAPARELYDRPANTFVAGFVGTPPMNLFPTRLLRASGGGIRMAIGDQDVALAPAGSGGAGFESLLDRPLTAGVRPEGLRLARDAEDALVATAEQVEFLGHETLVHARAAGADAEGIPLALRLPEPREVARGARLRLALDPARVHLFDAEGRALPSGPQ